MFYCRIVVLNAAANSLTYFLKKQPNCCSVQFRMEDGCHNNNYNNNKVSIFVVLRVIASERESAPTQDMMMGLTFFLKRWTSLDKEESLACQIASPFNNKLACF